MDNCYTLSPPLTCQNVSVNNTDLWHARLCHLNFKTLYSTANTGLVHGLPALGKKSPGVCEPCQFGKQLKSTHKATTQVATLKILELLHMNLMGPIPVSSVGGKNYIFVYVDNFSILGFIFLKEKSDTFDAFKKLCVKSKIKKST